MEINTQPIARFKSIGAAGRRMIPRHCTYFTPPRPIPLAVCTCLLDPYSQTLQGLTHPHTMDRLSRELGNYEEKEGGMTEVEGGEREDE